MGFHDSQQLLCVSGGNHPSVASQLPHAGELVGTIVTAIFRAFVCRCGLVRSAGTLQTSSKGAASEHVGTCFPQPHACLAAAAAAVQQLSSIGSATAGCLLCCSLLWTCLSGSLRQQCGTHLLLPGQQQQRKFVLLKLCFSSFASDCVHVMPALECGSGGGVCYTWYTTMR